VLGNAKHRRINEMKKCDMPKGGMKKAKGYAAGGNVKNPAKKPNALPNKAMCKSNTKAKK